ncbi:CD209 antigen-like protein C isoform X3 [Sinocyclocheilus grahami]|uniref:CD209 antigen-like protein C isoform X3 n=1 Tax=Sinocyclocheilus grahami TaxID=75366 RepID=UPI0007AC5BBE|nr:PREDICTED: CD209 antigen-like protein C isoform X3 [Sinocyclocheilus grahami]
MEDIENYTSLQEFTEDISQSGNRPILTSQGKQGVHKGAKCLRGQNSLVLLIALLTSVCANIVLGVLLIKCRPCPEDWLHLEGRCYFFSEDKLDWQHSKDSCASMGGHLSILHSHQQHHTLESVTHNRGGLDYHYWIGLSDIETEGVWKWVDNTVVNTMFWSEWDKEPINHQSGGIHGENCSVLDSHSITWFDVPCDFNYKRICEMDPITINI